MFLIASLLYVFVVIGILMTVEKFQRVFKYVRSLYDPKNDLIRTLVESNPKRQEDYENIIQQLLKTISKTRKYLSIGYIWGFLIFPSIALLLSRNWSDLQYMPYTIPGIPGDSMLPALFNYSHQLCIAPIGYLYLATTSISFLLVFVNAIFNCDMILNYLKTIKEKYVTANLSQKELHDSIRVLKESTVYLTG